MICCLLIALPICGISGTLVQLLGPTHFHRGSAATQARLVDPDVSVVALVDFRRDNVAATTMTPEQLHDLSHRQHSFLRHYHAADDVSVVVIDAPRDQGAVDGGGASASGSACLTWALVDALSLVEPHFTIRPWEHAEAVPVRTVHLVPLDRPPKA